MRRRKQQDQPEDPSDLIHFAEGSSINLSLWGQANGVRSLSLLPVTDIRATIGARITFEVVGIERVQVEGQRS